VTEKELIKIGTPAELKKKFGRALDMINRDDPDPEALDLLRKVLRDSDVFREVYGDLATHVREEIITELTNSRFTWESVRAWVNHIRNELGDESAPMLERLLIEQVATCWLRLCQVELTWSKIRSHRSVTLAQGAYWNRQLSAAQHRFLRACTTLARVRKMAGRTPELMQVNIGAQQLNVAQVSEN